MIFDDSLIFADLVVVKVHDVFCPNQHTAEIEGVGNGLSWQELRFEEWKGWDSILNKTRFETSLGEPTTSKHQEICFDFYSFLVVLKQDQQLPVRRFNKSVTIGFVKNG